MLNGKFGIKKARKQSFSYQVLFFSLLFILIFVPIISPFLLESFLYL